MNSGVNPHGGPDADGVPRHDLSTNANACGPYPEALRALQSAEARHYPDPAYTALTIQLAAWHGVAPERILPAASGSEFIQRISAAVALQAGAAGAAVWQPAHAYGDYARAARAAGLVPADDPGRAALLWACDPSSPLGQPQPGLVELVAGLRPAQSLVLDLAYEPLRLQGELALDEDALDRVWRLHSPNKALGLTGVRAAYAIAPRRAEAALLQRLRLLAPSWPLGAHGVALLQSWATLDAHAWLAGCRATLSGWKARQVAMLQSTGWRVEPGVANFFVAACACSARAGGSLGMENLLVSLRRQGYKLRDCTSFGLPSRLRIAVAAPEVQDGLLAALAACGAVPQEARP